VILGLAPNVPDPPLLVATVLALAAVELAKAERWRTLFAAAAPSYARCLRALVAGQLTNALSPLRAGEAVRLGLITAEGGQLVPAAAALAAAKAIDTLALAAIAASVLGAAVLGSGVWTLAAALLVLVAGTAAMLVGPRLRAWLLASPLARRLRLASIVDVAETLRRPRALAVIAAATAVVWLSGMAANWLVLLAVGTPPTVDLAARVIVVGYLSGLLPAPPGRLGVYEAAVVAALTSGGVPLGEAIPAAIALHICQLAELGLLLALSLVASGRWRPVWSRG
jgi:uncharacterized membrane protein YbhN (UPF0104 family)